MMKRKSLPVATQVTLTVTAAVVTALLLTGGILIATSFRMQLAQLRLIQEQRAIAVSCKIDAYVDDLQRKLGYLARVRGMATLDAATQLDLLGALINQNKAYESVGLVDGQGHLRQALSSSGEVLPREWAETSAFRRTFLENEDYVGQIESDSRSSIKRIVLAVPVRDQSNAVAGMLFARIDTRFLQTVLEEAAVEGNGYMFVLDQRRSVIALSGGLAEAPAFTEASNRTPDHMLESVAGLTTHTYRGLYGTGVVGIETHIPATGWHLVIELPLSEAYAPLWRLLGLMGSGLFLGLALAVTLGVSLARRITRPVQELARAATRLRLGELGTRVHLEGDDEFKVLADAFNHMATQLGDHIAALERDVVERGWAEEKARTLAEGLAQAQRVAHVGSWLWRIDTGTLEWSEEMYSIFGIAKKTFAGALQDVIEKAIHPDDRPAVERSNLSVMQQGKPIPLEYRVIWPDGTVRVVWAEAGELVRDGSGAPQVLTGIVQDITGRKLAEESLAESRRQSETYRQQVQRLESLGVLAGGIAHDFNNLLAGIYGNIDLAASRVTDPTGADCLSEAMRSMDQARGLTRQLLTFSKGGAPRRKVTSLPLLVREAVRFSLSGSNVQPTIDLPTDLWPCEIDGNQIRQVIQNIVLNAVHAMPTGGTIEVAARNSPLADKALLHLAGGDYIHLSIEDHGTGIPEDAIPRIFDPFYTTKSEGHGLGLAISHSIVTRHGGAITVKSQMAKGTVFHIYLPACRDRLPEETEAVVAVGHSGRGTVLVMDDEKSLCTMLSRMLRTFGYAAICTHQGADAIERFVEQKTRGSPFSAVILDLTVPGGMGGAEACQAIRKLDAEVPIFVTSGYAEDPIIANPRQYGFTGSIGKPFAMKELTAMLERHVGAGSSGPK